MNEELIRRARLRADREATATTGTRLEPRRSEVNMKLLNDLADALEAASLNERRYLWLKADADDEESPHAILFEVSSDKWDDYIDAAISAEARGEGTKP